MTRRESPVSPPVVLTVAGSDSGGGAGIQADLKTIEACGGFGTSAITSVTAQNTTGVQGSHLLPIDDIEAQIEAVTDDFDVAAVKTGMLATSDVVDLVTAHTDAFPHLVVDPVMVAASGDRLLAEEAEDAYEDLVAQATLVTPNADEAEVLTGVAVEDAEAAERAGRILVSDHGADAALVKGGHVPGDQVVDTLVTDATAMADTAGSDATDDDTAAVTTFRHDRVDTDASHGSGCALSSAIATHLAHGDDLPAAVGRGVDLLARAVRYNVDVGEGPGAVHHLVELRNDASRQSTADLVGTLADGLGGADLDSLAPSTGIGVVGATPHAEDAADVAAVVGPVGDSTITDDARTGDTRTGDATSAVTRTGDVPSAVTRTDDAANDTQRGDDATPPAVRYGGDVALGSVLLAAREAEPTIRFGALVAVAPSRIDALDGYVVEADDVGEHLDAAGPVPGAALVPIATAAGPTAVAVGRPANGDRSLAVVFGATTTELRDRLRSL